MSGTSIVTAIIEILVSGISGIASGIGAGFSTLAEGIFLTQVGESMTLSVFGTLIIVFAAISLGLALCRWVLNYITSLGSRNR